MPVIQIFLPPKIEISIFDFSPYLYFSLLILININGKFLQSSPIFHDRHNLNERIKVGIFEYISCWRNIKTYNTQGQNFKGCLRILHSNETSYSHPTFPEFWLSSNLCFLINILFTFFTRRGGSEHHLAGREELQKFLEPKNFFQSRTLNFSKNSPILGENF